MQSVQPIAGHQRNPLVPCALWSVDLKLTHLDWNPEATFIHFLGQYLSICELDYNILQREIQNTPKFKSTVDVGDFCLVEDLTSAGWYRGRVHGRKEDIFDVFLIDYGNILSVSVSNLYTCSNDLFSLPPKIVCGFLANILLLEHCPTSVLEKYFSSLIGRNVTGYIHALLPHKVLLLETPEINNDLVRQGFGRHVDTDTFLLLVEMITERQLKQNIEPVPDLLIEKPKRQEMCLKVSGLHGYDDILTSYGPKLSYGTCAKVRITAAVNPGLFYCQMASMEKELREMSKKLEAVCGHLSTGSNQKTSENLGSLCAVKGKDDKWYRGLVQFLPVNSQVRVLFIDYGFFELVRVENIRRLPLDFDSVPIMAFPCCLSSLSNKNEDAHAQQLTFLKKGLLGNVLDVEIRGTVSKQHAHLIAITGTVEHYKEEVETVQLCPQIKEEKEQLQPQCGYLYHQTALQERLVQTLEADDLQEGSVFVGYVTHVHNPQQFWMRTQKRNSDFEEMMAEIEVYYREKKLDEEILMNPKVGTACCAVYEKDMHFYRGVVTDILKHGAEVFFIDFGNTEKVPFKLIKKMPDAFAIQPGFAFCCSLVNALPLDEVWTTSTCDFFRRAMSNKALFGQIMQFKKNNVVVDLREVESDMNQSVSALMITSKKAEFWNNIPIQAVIESTDIAGNVKCSDKGPTKSKNQKALEPLCFRELCIKPGSELAVCCSSINSPSDFWCQPLDQKELLKELMDQIQLYYSTNTVVLQPGQLCCVAKLPHNKIWYRALITKQQRSNVEVMLIDYGCTAQIKRSNIQGVAPDFVHLEQQAFRCTLDTQIEPIEHGDWSAAACVLFRDFVRDNTCALRCKVSSQLNVENNRICNVADLDSDQTRQSIKKLLLKQGLARELIISKQLSSGFPETFVFSPFNINPGQEELIYVTHVNNQWDFYCQLVRNTIVLEELQNKIDAESEKKTQGSSQGLGKLCLAKYFDGNWYRAVARPVNFSPLHLSVFFVDYGNTSVNEKEHVKFIPEDCADLLEIPMQALRCHLASLNNRVLHPEVKEYFKETVLNRQIRALIAGTNKDGSFDVELFDGEQNINQKVNELIASLVPKPKPTPSPEKSHTVKKQKVLSRNRVETSVKTHASLDTSHTEKKQADLQSTTAQTLVKNHSQSKLCASTLTAPRDSHITGNKNDLSKNCKKHVNRAQSQSKGKKVNLQKGQMESCDTNIKQKSEQLRCATTDTSTFLCLSNNKVTKGFKAVCFVSHIDSSKSFFLQLEDDEPDILKMVEDLNSSFLKETLKKATSFRVSDLVLAVFDEDGALYRAALKDCKGSSSVNVEFVDYGNSAAIEKHKMYSVPTAFLSKPRFSIPCFLSKPRPYESEASFVDAVMAKPLMVEFVCQLGTRWEVRIETLNGAEGLSVPPETIEVVTGSDKTATETKGTLFVSEEDNGNYNENKDSMLTDERIMNVEMTTDKQLSVFQSLLPTNNNSSSHSEFQNEVEEGKGQANRLLFAPVHLNQAYAGSATAVKTPSEFYILLEDSKGDMSRMSVLLDGLPLQLSPLPEAHFTPGCICLFKSDTTQTWCRAEIMHLDTTVILSLVDSGHYEHAPSSALKKLPVELRNLPRLVYRCSLSGVVPVNPGCKWSNEAESHFQQCLSEKNLQITFREFVSDYYWKVEVLVDGVHVAKDLVDAGHASYTDVLLKLRFQECEAKNAECQDPDTEEYWSIDEEEPDISADGYKVEIKDNIKSFSTHCLLA